MSGPTDFFMKCLFGLVLLPALFFPSSLLVAGMREPSSVRVLFDPGCPEASVAIIENEIYSLGEIGSDHLRIQSFDSGAIVLQDTTSGEAVRWLERGDVPEELVRKAEYYFAARQLRALYEAQTRHLRDLGEYAVSLERLIHHGYLAGFEDGVKRAYRYRIENTGETGRQAPHYHREPVFLAVAEPLDAENGNFFFSVDHLGQVRYAPVSSQVTWGPVWDYADKSDGPPSRFLGVS